jgi:hypothetical protein
LSTLIEDGAVGRTNFGNEVLDIRREATWGRLRLIKLTIGQLKRTLTHILAIADLTYREFGAACMGYR